MRKSIGVVGNAPWHTGKAKEMHRKKTQINANESCSEVYLAKHLRIGGTRDLTHPVVPTSKNSKNSAHRKYVMEVRYNVIRVMKSYVNPRVRQNNSGQTSKGK